MLGSLAFSRQLSLSLSLSLSRSHRIAPNSIFTHHTPFPFVQSRYSSTTSTSTSCQPNIQSQAVTFPLPPILFVIGGPGAGKGTQSSLLSHHFGYPKLVGCGDTLTLDSKTLKETEIIAKQKTTERIRQHPVVHISMGSLLRFASTTPSHPFHSPINTALSNGLILPGHITVTLLKQELLRLHHLKQEIGEKRQFVCVIDGFPRTMNNVTEFECQIGPIEYLLYLQCTKEEMQRRLLARGRSDDTPPIIAQRMLGFETETIPVIQQLTQSGRTHVHEMDGMPPIPTVFSSTIPAFDAFLQWYTTSPHATIPRSCQYEPKTTVAPMYT